MVETLQPGQDWVWCYVDEMTLRAGRRRWVEVDLFYETGVAYMRDHLAAGGDPTSARTSSRQGLPARPLGGRDAPPARPRASSATSRRGDRGAPRLALGGLSGGADAKPPAAARGRGGRSVRGGSAPGSIRRGRARARGPEPGRRRSRGRSRRPRRRSPGPSRRRRSRRRGSPGSAPSRACGGRGAAAGGRRTPRRSRRGRGGRPAPSSTSSSIAALVAQPRRRRGATICAAIRSTCSAVSGRNVTISSIRLRNSGRNACLAAASHPRRPRPPARRRVKPIAALGLARAEVRGHDDHRVGEVDRAALAVGQPAVVHDLQQHVPDLRVGLLDLVEQDHAVRAPAHRLGQLAAVAVADVAGRRADQPRDRVRLAVLGHVDPDERLLGREQPLRERLDQLGLADAGRAEEQERARAGGRPRRGPTRARRIGVGDDLDGLVLADHALVQVVLERRAGARARRRPARPPGCRCGRRRPRRRRSRRRGARADGSPSRRARQTRLELVAGPSARPRRS